MVITRVNTGQAGLRSLEILYLPQGVSVNLEFLVGRSYTPYHCATSPRLTAMEMNLNEAPI